MVWLRPYWSSDTHLFFHNTPVRFIPTNTPGCPVLQQMRTSSSMDPMLPASGSKWAKSQHDACALHVSAGPGLGRVSSSRPPLQHMTLMPFIPRPLRTVRAV
ncbi:hypothetical protein PISMIDRAFT_651790 [Pisolithus microcarpus 441]|uniref:Uncharacterized protein n=1 Tax=Pisolithus microcarpus 441 TaxID=765257 RepID=A0A0C9Y2M4_9AGAM|nr:hypothetical protein PISMIDRAFT_651790 [Pisolithus microcarpus 441]